jgi:hypothetical protein
MWTQLAVALVFELEIHRAGSGEVGQISSKADWNPPRTLVGPTRSMEERRAILGVFIVSSMQDFPYFPTNSVQLANPSSHRVWTSLRQMEALRWTPYMDDCVRILREESEAELDFLLAFQAKCYVVVNQMIHSHSEWTTDGEGPRPPAAYFIKALQLQLQGIRQSLPAEMQPGSQY